MPGRLGGSLACVWAAGCEDMYMGGCRALDLHLAGMSRRQVSMRSGSRQRVRLDGCLSGTWAAGCIFVAQGKNHIFLTNSTLALGYKM